MNVKLINILLSLIASLVSVASFAQAPDGSTGMCKDGTYTTASTKKGACAGHKGVQEWFAHDAAPAASAKPSKTVAPTTANSPMPDGSTGMCKDGTYTTASTKKGACAGHKGVQEWFANDAAPVVAEKASPTTSPATQTNSTIKKEPVKKSAALGGGSGQVWVNTDSKVYHCEGGRYYGKTKQGEYMSEAAAKASGARPDHGKACS